MRGTIKYLIFLLVSMLSVSCVSDSDPDIMPTDEPRNIIFTVSLAENKTRAAWEEVYPSEEGVLFDFRINPEKLHVVIFAEDGTRLGTLENLLYFPTDDSDTQFLFIGQMPEAFAKHFNDNADETVRKYKFMVLANCDASTSGEQYITFNHAQLHPSNVNASIPMWGVTEVELTPLEGNQRWDIGDISLLRAAAKVEVKLSDELKNEGTTINSATLKYYNQTGYVLPSGGMTALQTADLDQEECVRVYRHAAETLPFIKDETTGNYYVYVTEYDNINYSGERNKISLTCKVGDEEKTFEDAISFCRYSEGLPDENSPYNIVRNHIYEFTITKIAGSNLVLEYTVANWTTEDWDGNGKDHEEHLLEYPTYHNPVVPEAFLSLDGQEQENYTITQEPKMYFSGEGNLEKGGFDCYFQILAPVGVMWKPVFMGSEANYQIRVYKVDSNLKQDNNAIFDTEIEGLQNNLGVCEAGEWFHLIIFPKSANGAGTTNIDLGITYYQDWTDQYINLYINGEYGNIRWPQSGDNPKLIKIKHVSQ